MFVDQESPESEILRNKFNRLRGETINEFSNAEFMMRAFLVAFDEKAEFDNSAGYFNSIESVTRNFKLVFENLGLEDAITEDIFLLIKKFETVINDRHQFVHGLARLNTKGRRVDISRFRPKKSNEPKPLEGEKKYELKNSSYYLDNLEERVHDFCEICGGIIELIRYLDGRLGLEIPSLA